MAETSISDEVRSASLPTEAQPTPTPLQGLTNSLGLLPAYMGAGAKEVSGIRESVGRQRAESADFGAVAAANKQTAEAARPEALAIPKPPSLAARPFLAPGEGMLAQLQTALLGATQMALGVGGATKGGGYAIAAVAGLKGALEGWQIGDHARSTAALKEWEANSQKLLEEHRARREAYADLLTNMDRDMANRLAQIGINARIDGRMDLANAAERQQVGDVLNILTSSEQHERDFTVKIATLRESIARHHQSEARMERDHADLQRQRGIVNARAVERQKLAAENSRVVRENEALAVGAQRTLDDAAQLKQALEFLDSEKVLNTGPTVWDKGRLALAVQSKPGRTDILDALETVRRIGGPLIVRREITSGMTAGLLRLAPIAKQEVGDLNALPKVFWDRVLETAIKRGIEDRDRARRHLDAIGRSLPGIPEGEDPDDPLGIK